MSWYCKLLAGVFEAAAREAPEVELDCVDIWRLLCREYVNFLVDVVEVLVEDFADVVEEALVVGLVVLGFGVVDVEEVLSVVEVDLVVVDDVDSVDLIEAEEGAEVEDACEETLDEKDFADEVVVGVVVFEIDTV